MTIVTFAGVLYLQSSMPADTYTAVLVSLVIAFMNAFLKIAVANLTLMLEAAETVTTELVSYYRKLFFTYFFNTMVVILVVQELQSYLNDDYHCSSQNMRSDIYYAECYYSNAGPVSTAFIAIITQAQPPPPLPCFHRHHYSGPASTSTPLLSSPSLLRPSLHLHSLASLLRPSLHLQSLAVFASFGVLRCPVLSCRLRLRLPVPHIGYHAQYHT